MQLFAEKLREARAQKKTHAGQGVDFTRKSAQMQTAIIEPVMPQNKQAPPRHLRAASAINEGLMMIGPDLAEQIIAELRFKGQREANAKHVTVLAELMRRGVFTAGTQLHFGQFEDDGSLHLLNGQHRLLAVIAAKTPMEFQVLISQAINERELATLYWRHDRAARLRNANDVLGAEGICAQFGLNKSIAAKGYSAVGIIIADFVRAEALGNPFLTRSDEARLEAAQPYWPLMAAYQAAIATAPAAIKRKLMGAGIMAVALITLRYQFDRARLFWYRVGENDRLAKKDPAATFLRDLQNKKIDSAYEWAKVAAAAWNANYREEFIHVLKVVDGPIVISGTPYTQHRRKRLMTALDERQ